jgi:hypothetical protein
MTELAHEMLTPDAAEAERFLKIIGRGATRFTFQTFDEREDRKKAGIANRSLTKVLHGTLAEHFDELARLNALGAGVYVTINETDLRGRKKANITKVRALFIDGDDVERPEKWDGAAPRDRRDLLAQVLARVLDHPRRDARGVRGKTAGADRALRHRRHGPRPLPRDAPPRILSHEA